jgi:hypothetical protein
MDQRRLEKAYDLLKRARVSEHVYSKLKTEDQIGTALAVVDDLLCDTSPDEDWWRDYFLFTGDHMHLTEEGLIPAEMNTYAYTGSSPMEVLEEINAPAERKELPTIWIHLNEMGGDTNDYAVCGWEAIKEDVQTYLKYNIGYCFDDAQKEIDQLMQDGMWKKAITLFNETNSMKLQFLFREGKRVYEP